MTSVGIDSMSLVLLLLVVDNVGACNIVVGWHNSGDEVAASPLLAVCHNAVARGCVRALLRPLELLYSLLWVLRPSLLPQLWSLHHCWCGYVVVVIGHVVVVI